ncbi:MAG: Fumble domain-containing protein [Calditrichia bacterium]
MQAALDFGLSNTDLVIFKGHSVEYGTSPSRQPASSEQLRLLLTKNRSSLRGLQFIGVTGGRHKELPDQLDGVPIYKINEVEAIGRGGQSLGKSESNSMLVVSAGSGTAMITARNSDYTHAGGTAVGGGTLLGLSRLLLGTTDPGEIDKLARRGDRNQADLAISDVISGPIGSLTPDATAVNFGRLAREDIDIPKMHLAASLVTMVGQTIALIAINIARAQQLKEIVVIGHLSDMESMRKAISAVGDLYKTPIHLPEHSGNATAYGALSAARELHEKQ